MHIILSTNSHPEINAAYEELLLRESKHRGAYLFLYLNRPAVLLGRNQNPWAECNLDYCRENRITILRRISGGGAVFHDLHNLNAALILPRNAYAPEKLLKLILGALKRLGMPELYLNDHYSIFCRQRKICGSAFALTGRAALLHACMLIDTDLNTLNAALTPPAGQRIIGTCVGSNRKPVMKLTEMLPGINVRRVALELIRQTRMHYRHVSVDTIGLQASSPLNAKFYDSIRKFRDPTWTFGHTNDFILERTFPQGLLKLTVASGFVIQAVLFTMSGQQLPLPELTCQPLAHLQHPLGYYLSRPKQPAPTPRPLGDVKPINPRKHHENRS